MLQPLSGGYDPSSTAGNCPSMILYSDSKKLIHNLISLVFFLVGTRLEIQSENLIGTIILALYNLFTSFSMDDNNLGLILLSFCRNGFGFCLMGIVC